jgi:hypothetical protein
MRQGPSSADPHSSTFRSLHPELSAFLLQECIIVGARAHAEVDLPPSAPCMPHRHVHAGAASFYTRYRTVLGIDSRMPMTSGVQPAVRPLHTPDGQHLVTL